MQAVLTIAICIRITGSLTIVSYSTIVLLLLLEITMSI